MSSRHDHLFQFPASHIATAARAEAQYHRARIASWQAEEAAAAERVRHTIHAELDQHLVTGGSQWFIDIKYGDQTAWHQLNLAASKIKDHLTAAERLESDATMYGSQDPNRSYELNAEDVAYFRLAGPPRNEPNPHGEPFDASAVDPDD